MTTWYVRPDTSHSAARDGKSYATAWGGWAAIDWSGAGVKAGDTLYVCGTHAASATLNVGYHGSTAGNPAVIRGDYAPDPGALIFTGSAWLFNSRDHTTIQGLSITAGSAYCIYLYGAPLTGTTILQCTLTSAANTQIINLHSADTLAYVDLDIDRNQFIGGNGTNVGSAINWYALAGLTSARYLTRVTIRRNRFTGSVSNRSTINLTVEDSASSNCKITDLIIADNTFTDCTGVALVAYAGVFGRNAGIRITDNKIYGQLNKPAGMGGGFMIGGFGLSATDGFGLNVITRNRAYRLAGPTGFSNAFYGTYTYFGNYAEDISTDTIDGNGLLFDHGCDGCVAYGNQFRRITGTGADGYYSGGFGILVLDATNVSAYGNRFDGCVTGVGFGNVGPGQSANIFNNTFRNCSQSGAFVGAGAATTNLARNNIFTASRGTIPSVKNNAAAWTGESYNLFHGFAAPSGHTLAASSKTANPLARSDGRLKSGSPAISAGTYLPGSDYFGNAFSSPPNMGAVEGMVKRTPLVPGKSMRSGSRAVMR